MCSIQTIYINLSLTLCNIKAIFLFFFRKFQLNNFKHQLKNDSQIRRVLIHTNNIKMINIFNFSYKLLISLLIISMKIQCVI